LSLLGTDGLNDVNRPVGPAVGWTRDNWEAP
jgi:hypothetical protein